MTSSDELSARVRGEFGEMPGLRLTLPQASRLWQMDSLVCEAVLDALVRERFLNRTSDGAYIALPSPRGQVKVELHATVQMRRSA